MDTIRVVPMNWLGLIHGYSMLQLLYDLNKCVHETGRKSLTNPAYIYMFQHNNGNIRTMWNLFKVQTCIYNPAENYTFFSVSYFHKNLHFTCSTEFSIPKSLKLTKKTPEHRQTHHSYALFLTLNIFWTLFFVHVSNISHINSYFHFF